MAPVRRRYLPLSYNHSATTCTVTSHGIPCFDTADSTGYSVIPVAMQEGLEGINATKAATQGHATIVHCGAFLGAAAHS